MEDLEKTIESVDLLYKKFPPEVYLKTVNDIVEDLEHSYTRVIQRKRDKYNQLTSFKEKKTYFDTTLKLMEEVYQKCIRQLEDFKRNQQLERYELWVTPRTIEQMKEYGYRTIIQLEISNGGIIKHGN